MARIYEKIPDRWLDYAPYGKQIGDSPFISFKVPLRLRSSRQNKTMINKHTPESKITEYSFPSTIGEKCVNNASLLNDNYKINRGHDIAIMSEIEASNNLYSKDSKEGEWTPQTLMQTLPNLAMVIDLTNTNSYYNGYQDLKMIDPSVSRSIRYIKIRTPGHIIPHSKLVSRFFYEVDKFLHFKKEGLIGVHCTHGVNRTGYMICRYLIQRLNWDPKHALMQYANDRGYPIERQNYILNLKRASWESIPPPQYPNQQDAVAMECCCLGVFGLNRNTTENCLWLEFEKFGVLKNLHLARNHNKQSSRGFAFVLFERFEDAKRAITSLNHYVLHDRKIRVEYAPSRIEFMETL